jgi:hypothetical protein
MAVELKEVVEKAATKKEVIVKGAKGTRKKNEWWDKEFKQLKKIQRQGGKCRGEETDEMDNNGKKTRGRRVGKDQYR